VFILDWDVHHGNGTQEIFFREAAVVFCSLHQEAWYPGTGAIDETGEGPAVGTKINIPLPAGVGDGGYRHLFEEVVVPLLRAAAPPLILISAGFDAHHADPLGGMLMTARGFGHLARLVLDPRIAEQKRDIPEAPFAVAAARARAVRRVIGEYWEV
jgi:acetoin utilization deacetylase AcuC-like enzyme